MQALSLARYCRSVPVLLAVAALVSGCASGLSKDECQTADWRSIGYEDGVRGLPESRIAKHRKSCAEHGVAMRLDDYRMGREEGIQRFCQPGNGYSQGRSGRRYSGICPNELEAEYLNAYREGREVYTLETNVKRTARTLSRKQQRLDNIEVEIRNKGIELVQEGIPMERRVVLLDELRKLEKEHSEIRAEIPVIQAELERQKASLAQLSASQVY